MDDRRFDNVVRALATARSRRQALRVLGGSLAGALAGVVGIHRTEGAHQCGHGNSRLCPSGQTCCGSGSNAQCKNLQTDPNNCGACGNGCGNQQQCVNGQCT